MAASVAMLRVTKLTTRIRKHQRLVLLENHASSDSEILLRRETTPCSQTRATFVSSSPMRSPLLGVSTTT